jgi:hypothetical protein
MKNYQSITTDYPYVGVVADLTGFGWWWVRCLVIVVTCFGIVTSNGYWTSVLVDWLF